MCGHLTPISTMISNVQASTRKPSSLTWTRAAPAFVLSISIVNEVWDDDDISANLSNPTYWLLTFCWTLPTLESHSERLSFVTEYQVGRDLSPTITVPCSSRS